MVLEHKGVSEPADAHQWAAAMTKSDNPLPASIERKFSIISNQAFFWLAH